MKIALLLPTFNRDELLSFGLQSIRQQLTPKVDVVVLDEGKPNGTEELASRFDARYFWTGRTKADPDYWRVPGFPLNIGIKQTDAEVIVLSCPEIYHLQPDTIARLVAPLENDPMALCIGEGRDDGGAFLHALRVSAAPVLLQDAWDHSPPLNTELPFLVALRREHLLAIGGYDEDFIGVWYDDNDIVDRLVAHGLRYVQTSARCCHLHHVRSANSWMDRRAYNKRLYDERWGQIVRNVGRDWGALDG